MMLRERSKGITKGREKTEYEKMIEAQRRLGITDVTRNNKRKIQSLISNGVVIDPDAPKKPKLDKAETIQKELMEDLLAYIKTHPYS